MSTLSIVPSGSWPPRGFFDLFPKQEEGERITLHENRSTFLVVAVFPGFIKDDIRINFRNGVLTIYAASYLVSRSQQYAKRNIHRTVQLSGEVDEDQIRYLYERNELRIWIPKKRGASSRSFDMIRRFPLFRRFRLR